MKIHRHVRVGGPTSLALVAILAASGCGNSAEGEESEEDFFADQPLRVIVTTAAGGGFDSTMRQLQPAIANVLDTQVIVENLEGASTSIGSQAAANATPDCTTLMFTGVPHLQYSYVVQDVDYDLEDFVPVGGVSTEPMLILVREDAPWETAEEFFEDALERPGEISVSVGERSSSQFLGLINLQQAAEIDFNIISYDGGSLARTAVLSGEVDATHAGVFNSQSIDDDTRILAVQQSENEWPEETDDAPTLESVLETEVEDAESLYTLWAPAGCEEEHPERYQALVDMLPEALEDPEYLSDLESLGEEQKVHYLNPDELYDEAKETESQYEQIMSDSPGIFSE